MTKEEEEEEEEGLLRSLSRLSEEKEQAFDPCGGTSAAGSDPNIREEEQRKQQV